MDGKQEVDWALVLLQAGMKEQVGEAMEAREAIAEMAVRLQMQMLEEDHMATSLSQGNLVAEEVPQAADQTDKEGE